MERARQLVGGLAAGTTAGAALAAMALAAGCAGGAVSTGTGRDNPGGSPAPRVFATQPHDDAAARRTLDVAVRAALSGTGWTVLERHDDQAGTRVYTLHSLRDEPGTLRVGPAALPSSAAAAATHSSAWRWLDPDTLTIEATVGLFPESRRNRASAAALAKALRQRLSELRPHGHAPASAP